MSKTACIFPGQGSQYVGMGRDLAEQFSEAKDIFSQLVDRNLIKLKTESDRHGADFTVFNINKNNPVVRIIGRKKKGKK